MAGNIRLEVVTPEKSVVSEEIQTVVVPGNLGDFGVLKGHTPFLSTLKTGSLRYMDANNVERYVFVSGGFSEALPDKVTVLAESAERRRDIDIQRAKSSLERAQRRLAEASKKEDINFMRANIALERALHRLKIAGSRA